MINVLFSRFGSPKPILLPDTLSGRIQTLGRNCEFRHRIQLYTLWEFFVNEVLFTRLIRRIVFVKNHFFFLDPCYELLHDKPYILLNTNGQKILDTLILKV